MTQREEARAAFVERLSEMLVEAGTQRMAARVFAALLASDEAQLTAADLATQLSVSPAAVSGAVRYLEQTSLVRRTRPLGSRRDVITFDDDGWYRTFVDRSPLLRVWGTTMAQGAADLGAGTAAGRRLVESAEFFTWMAERFPALLAEWEAGRARR